MKKLFALSLLSLVFLASSCSHAAPRRSPPRRGPIYYSSYHRGPQYRRPSRPAPRRVYNHSSRGRRVEYAPVARPRRNSPPPRRDYRPVRRSHRR
jgi:hypothetical protein